MLRYYLVIIFLITLYVFVDRRQQELRKTLRELPDCGRVVSFKVTREDADKDLVHCLKYFLTYGFYKFGVEITLACLTFVIARRMDVFTVLYTIWLVILVCANRKLQCQLWPVFTISVLILVLVQYIIVLKLLPLLLRFDWFEMLRSESHLGTAMRLNWLSIPVYHIIETDSSKMYYDCVLLILSSIQLRMFKEEKDLKDLHPGGSNQLPISEEWEEIFTYPIKDFFLDDGTWLDKMKCALFITMPSICIALAVVAAINDVNFFSVGYFIGSFIFFWHGNNIFLRRKSTLMLWWSRLLYYTTFVLAVKVLVRIPACVYNDDIKKYEKNRFSLKHLFGISCFDAYEMISNDLYCTLCTNGNSDTQSNEKVESNDVDAKQMMLNRWCETIKKNEEEAVENDILISKEIPKFSLGDLDTIYPFGEVICLVFLLLQRRMFHSYYYHRVVDNFKATFAVAPRGFAVYKKLFQKRLQKQTLTQNTLKEKIKIKMRKIMSQVILEDIMRPDDSRIPANTEVMSHQNVIRSGDYYMFREINDESLNIPTTEDSSDEEAPEEEDFIMLKSKCYSREISRKSGKDDNILPEQENNAPIQDPDSFIEKVKCFSSRLNVIISEFLLTITTYLLKASRDYRYVSRTLAREKNILKENEEFKIGVRKNSYMTWEPLPETLQATQNTEEPKSQENMTKIYKSSFFHFFNAVYYGLLANTDKICYIAVFLNQMYTAALLSLPLPLMVFLWGTLTTPRPSKKFWITLIIYTMMVILVKTMFQSNTITWLDLDISDDDPFRIFTIIGVERKKNFAVWDILLLIALFLHRNNLEFQGLWMDSTKETINDINTVSTNNAIEINDDDNYQNESSTPEHNIEEEKKPAENNLEERRLSMDSTKGIENINLLTPNSDDEFKDEFEAENYCQDESTTAKNGFVREKLGENNLEEKGQWIDPIKENIENMNVSEINELKNEDDCQKDDSTLENIIIIEEKKPMKNQLHPHFLKRIISGEDRIATDLYAFMFFCDFINIFIVIFNYPAFGRFQSSLQEYLMVNKVPPTFLVMLLLQFCLIVLDRVIYLWKFMLAKVYLQFILIIGVHLWMFFVLPFFTEIKFYSVWPPPMWYMFKCIYLLLAARQITSGYPSRIFGNVYCKSYSLINMIMFRVYMAIPFLFEVRNVMDWICTETSMSIMDWLKMEDIYAHIFLLKCARTIEKRMPQPKATKKQILSKLLFGGALFIVVINIIWFPLLFFAFGNKIGKPNPPSEVTLKIQIGGFQPIYQATANSRDIKPLTPDEYERIMELHSKSRVIRTLFANYEPEDITRVSFPANSLMKWDLTPSDIKRFEKYVDSTLNKEEKWFFKIKYTIARRSHEGENLQVLEDSVEKVHDYDSYVKYDMWLEWFNLEYDIQTHDDWVNLYNLFPRHVKVSNKEGLKFLNVVSESKYGRNSESKYYDVDLKMLLHGNNTYSWAMRIPTDYKEDSESVLFGTSIPDELPSSNLSKIVILTFNDKIVPGTFDSLYITGIIGLYTTFVLVAARLTRNFSSGAHREIMFKELPNVDRILQLCHDIYLVREAQEWDLEESLFAKLIFLYRSPETMVKWSRFPHLRDITPPE